MIERRKKKKETKALNKIEDDCSKENNTGIYIHITNAHVSHFFFSKFIKGKRRKK